MHLNGSTRVSASTSSTSTGYSRRGSEFEIPCSWPSLTLRDPRLARWPHQSLPPPPPSLVFRPSLSGDDRTLFVSCLWCSALPFPSYIRSKGSVKRARAAAAGRAQTRDSRNLSTDYMTETVGSARARSESWPTRPPLPPQLRRKFGGEYT